MEAEKIPENVYIMLNGSCCCFLETEKNLVFNSSTESKAIHSLLPSQKNIDSSAEISSRSHRSFLSQIFMVWPQLRNVQSTNPTAEILKMQNLKYGRISGECVLISIGQCLEKSFQRKRIWSAHRNSIGDWTNPVCEVQSGPIRLFSSVRPPFAQEGSISGQDAAAAPSKYCC